MKLDVKYRAQLDNSEETGQGNGYRQCNPTSNAMFADYIRKQNGFAGLDSLAKPAEQGEDYFARIVSRYGDCTVHANITKALLNLRIVSEYGAMPLSSIKAQLDEDKPVPIGVRYKADGHIVCVVGYAEDGLWIHDPYGVRYGSENRYNTKASGAYDKYSYALFAKLHDGMGRAFLSFDASK